MSDKLFGTVKAGTTDVSIPVLLTKTADGTEQTAVAHSSVTASYWRQGGTRTAITMASLTNVNDAHSDGGWKEVDSTNQPGLYRFDILDAAFASGAEWVVISVKVADCFVYHERFNIESVGSAELSARIPSALVSGKMDSNTSYWNGSAVATPNTAGVPKADLVLWLGSTPDALSSGKIPADLKLWLATAPLALSSQMVQGIVAAYATNQAPLQPTVAGRTLDVTSTGEAGLDFDNIKQATGATTLTNIRVPNVTLTDTLTTYTNNTPQTGDSYAVVSHGTYGLAALKSLIDTVKTDTGNVVTRLGAFTGTGVNTVLGMFKALMSKTASTPSDVGGTYDASTDSTEALRDRGDAAWITGEGGTGGGSGAYAVTTTVLDADAVPVAGAAVRLRNLTSNDVANTDVDGLATLNKDAGTYTRIVTAAGYEAFTDTVVVDGDETLSDVELTAIVIEAAADELQCACYLYARDAGGAIQTGKKHLFRLSALPAGDGSSYGPEIEATSDDTGLVEVDLLRGKTYLMQRGETWDSLADSSDQVTVEVPNNAGPFELPNVWSNDN